MIINKFNCSQMKSVFCALFLTFLLVAPVHSVSVFDTIEEYLEAGFDQISHDFGGIHLIREVEEGLSEAVVYWPENGYLSEANHFLDVYSILRDSHSNPDKYKNVDLLTCAPGAKSDYLKWVPSLVGSAKLGEITTFSSPCFGANTVTLRQVSENSVVLEHNVSNYSSWSCADTFFYANTQNYHLTSLFFSGTHRTTFSGLTDYQMKEIKRSGIKLFRVCDSLINIFPDIFKTVLLFFGGFSTNPNIPFFGSHTPFWMVDANIEFIKHATGYEWKKRANSTRFDLDPKYIKSGDFIAATRFHGMPQLIQYGSGSHAGHSIAALWIDDELYFVESQGGWYWPQQGIQRTPYKQWLEWADNADVSVTILPLKPEIREKFNATAAYEWFKTVEGLPYGYHNFLFGWIDTANDSFPPVVHPEFLPPMLAIVESISPAKSSVFNEAINKRLGTENLTIPQMAEVIEERGLTFSEVYAIPEQDDWVYSDGKSLVCSSFVVAFWKAGGLFGDMEIQATEFTPRDAYSLTFIDPNPELPPECKYNDPDAQFCQVMGQLKLEFPQLSTVDPYPHMNERCPSRADNNYFRPAGC